MLWISLLMLLFVSTVLGLDNQEQFSSYWKEASRQQLNRALNRVPLEDRLAEAKNIILFIGDGMGIATVTATGILKGGEGQLLSWEKFPTVGLVKTYSVDHTVPDSGSTATAFLTGSKTRSKILGLDGRANRERCDKDTNKAARISSIAEWAQAAGKHTGVVTTARITHATPAALYAHINHRDWECDTKITNHSIGCVADIARQLVEDSPGKEFRVVLGGGRRCMGITGLEDYDEDDTCVRGDKRNIAKEWTSLGGGKRVFVNNTEQLMDPNLVKDADYVMGIFSGGHMDYEAERDKSSNGQPSLSNMTRQAIRMLKKHPGGFFLMVEGGRVDMAHHKNYARLAFLEGIQLDQAVNTALDEVDLKDTLVIVTADHSHAMTINGYPLKGSDILGITMYDQDTPEDNVIYETISYANGPGAKPHSERPLSSFSKEERSQLRYQHFAGIYTGEDETHGGEDVAIYSVGPGAGLLGGVFEQNYIARAMAYILRIGDHRKDPGNNDLPAAAIKQAPPSGESVYTLKGSATVASPKTIFIAACSILLILIAKCL